MYATVQDVLTYTGASVSSEAVARAQAVVEMFSNRTEASSGTLSDNDLHWMKLAVCYQAAYLDAHPDAMQTMDVASYGQGDISISFKGSADTIVMAPLAKRAVSRLSWHRSRTLSVTSDFVRNVDVIDAEDDEWEAL